MKTRECSSSGFDAAFQAKHALFRRMVETMHARGSELQDSTGKRYIFSYLPNWPELSEAAQAILAELDAG